MRKGGKFDTNKINVHVRLLGTQEYFPIQTLIRDAIFLGSCVSLHMVTTMCKSSIRRKYYYISTKCRLKREKNSTIFHSEFYQFVSFSIGVINSLHHYWAQGRRQWPIQYCHFTLKSSIWAHISEILMLLNNIIQV